MPIQFGPSNTFQSYSSLTLDNKGQGHWELEHAGIWQLRFIHKRDSSAGGFSAPNDFLEPYDSATAILAASPNLPDPPSTSLQMRHVEPPAVDVVVQDGNGNPVRAIVSILKGS